MTKPTNEQVALVKLVMKLTRMGRIRWERPKEMNKNDGFEVDMTTEGNSGAEVFFQIKKWGPGNGPTLFIYRDADFRDFWERIDECHDLCESLLKKVINFWKQVDHFAEAGLIDNEEDMVQRGEITSKTLLKFARKERADKQAAAQAKAAQKAKERQEQKEREAKLRKQRILERQEERLTTKRLLIDVLTKTKNKYC